MTFRVIEQKDDAAIAALILEISRPDFVVHSTMDRFFLKDREFCWTFVGQAVVKSPYQASSLCDDL